MIEIQENTIIKEIEEENDTLFEQWKVYVQMADKVSERRGKNNTFFTTINTTVITLYTTSFIGVGKNLLNILGIIISVFWIISIKNYALLNKAKFSVINKIEKRLPVEGFTEEWKYLKNSKYSTLTSIEKYVPIVFVAINIILLWQNGAFNWLLNFICKV